jgi:hypothetical protein
MDIEKLRNKEITSEYRISRHAQKRLDERAISNEEFIQVILSGEIIEDYPNDKPYPSCLIMGYVRNDEPLYVVCAVNDLVHIITVHWIDYKKWLDPKTRREKQI